MLLGVTHQDPAAAVLLETQEGPSLIRQVLIALLGASDQHPGTPARRKNQLLGFPLRIHGMWGG